MDSMCFQSTSMMWVHSTSPNNHDPPIKQLTTHAQHGTMADPNLAVLIFLLVLLTQVVAWIGKSVLQEVASAAYTRAFLGNVAKEQRRLRKQVLDDKAELGRTSSQDEFAKWAKLRRKVDKGLADLERSSEWACWRLGELAQIVTLSDPLTHRP